MPRPRSLTPAQIAAAALALTARDGADALTMSALARELGTATMSLYRYVDGREHVEALMLDEVLSNLDSTVPANRPPATQALTLLTRLYDALAAHPEAIPIVLARRSTSPSALRWGEAMLSVLSAAGLAGEALVIAFRSLLSHLIGALQVDRFAALSGAGTAEIASLELDVFPHLVAAATQARTITATEEFVRGAEALIKGLGVPTNHVAR